VSSGSNRPKFTETTTELQSKPSDIRDKDTDLDPQQKKARPMIAGRAFIP
jgi:hypothetical protein